MAFAVEAVAISREPDMLELGLKVRGFSFRTQVATEMLVSILILARLWQRMLQSTDQRRCRTISCVASTASRGRCARSSYGHATNQDRHPAAPKVGVRRRQKRGRGVGLRPAGDCLWPTSKRSWNNHQLGMRELLDVARLRRKDPFHQADEAELKAAVARIAGPAGWYVVAGWAPEDVDFRVYRFATAAQAAAVQHWIAESGIETWPAPEPYRGPQL